MNCCAMATWWFSSRLPRVDGASLLDLSVYKKGGGVDGDIWGGQTALSKAGIVHAAMASAKP